MGYFDWDAKFETGVQRMDQQHQRLIGLMNRLFDESEQSRGRDKLIRTLEELGALTTAHFAEEEQFMANIGYAELSSHKLIHKQLLETYSEHVGKFKTSKTERIPSPFFTFLKLWLSSHILGIDARYGAAAKRGAA